MPYLPSLHVDPYLRFRWSGFIFGDIKLAVLGVAFAVRGGRLVLYIRRVDLSDASPPPRPVLVLRNCSFFRTCNVRQAPT